MGCLNVDQGMNIIRAYEETFLTFEPHNKEATEIILLPFRTPNFNVLNYRVSLVYREFGIPKNFWVSSVMTFYSSSNEVLHSEGCLVNSGGTAMIERMMYNKENMIVTGVDHAQLLVRGELVDGQDIEDLKQVMILSEVFYSPIQY